MRFAKARGLSSVEAIEELLAQAESVPGLGCVDVDAGVQHLGSPSELERLANPSGIVGRGRPPSPVGRSRRPVGDLDEPGRLPSAHEFRAPGDGSAGVHTGPERTF